MCTVLICNLLIQLHVYLIIIIIHDNEKILSSHFQIKYIFDTIRSAWDYSAESERPALLAAGTAKAAAGSLFSNMNAKEATVLPEGQEIEQRTHMHSVRFILLDMILHS